MAQVSKVFPAEQQRPLRLLAGGQLIPAVIADSGPVDGASLLGVMRPVCVSVKTSVDLETLGSLFIHFGLGSIPVVDDEGALIGSVSQADLVREVVESAEWHPTAMRVGDVMTRDAAVVTETASIAEAASIMAAAAVRTLAVLSARGVLVGIVDGADIVAWLAEHGGRSRYGARAGLRARRIAP